MTRILQSIDAFELRLKPPILTTVRTALGNAIFQTGKPPETGM